MVVDAKGQSTKKELEQKILYQFGLPGHMSTDQGTHFTDHNVKQWAERHPPQSDSFIGNWNRQLKHWLFKTGGDVGMKGWFTCLQDCVLRLDIRGAKGVFLLDRFLRFFGGPGREGVGEDGRRGLGGLNIS